MAYPTDWMPCPNLHAFASRKKARKFALKQYGEEFEDITGSNAVTATTRDDKGHIACLVVIEANGESTAQKMALLAHECVHVAQAWADCMGEKKPGDEWMAYAVQSAMLECLKQLGDEWQR